MHYLWLDLELVELWWIVEDVEVKVMLVENFETDVKNKTFLFPIYVEGGEKEKLERRRHAMRQNKQKHGSA